MLATDRLLLAPTTVPMLDAALGQDWPRLSSLLDGASLAGQWSHFDDALAWMRQFLIDRPDPSPWWHYLIVHRADHRLIGTCGFKGAPSAEGTVEMGYEIDDQYQGRGLATEAAGKLVAFAFAQPGVQAVLAHTLATENASVQVLRKNGFAFVREKIDPDDGPVWEWRITGSLFGKKATATPSQMLLYNRPEV